MNRHVIQFLLLPIIKGSKMANNMALDLGHSSQNFG